MNYEEDIRIDETALDVEWLEQPMLMMQYSRHAAQMRMDMDMAKERLETTKAEVDKDIRSDPERFGLAKITEGAVTSLILGDERYKEANQTFLEAKFESDIAQGAVRAFDARKDALENLVRLHGQQYFAGPKVPRDISWEKEERQKRLNAKIGQKIKRTR